MSLFQKMFKLARLITLLLLLVPTFSDVAYSAASPPRMRPYSGIGVVILPVPDSDRNRRDPFHLYEEPGIYRNGELNSPNSSGNEWIFGEQKSRIPLIVMARKGNWLRVCYDDAGREAWIDTQRRGTFQSWDQFLKGQVIRLLPGLRKQYYQLYLKPESDPIAALTPSQLFKVLKMEDDRVMVMPDQNTIGWLRWRDEDGRLLIGVGSELKQ